jgi:acyl-CoA thioesterase I
MKRMLIIIALIGIPLLILWSVKLVILKQSVAENAAYWRQTVEPLPEHIRYIALGDSAAQAIGASVPTKGYVGLVAGALSKKHRLSVHVTNLSQSGATVQDAVDKQLPKLREMTITADTVITVEIGANDMKHYDEQAFKSRIEELYAQLPSRTVVSTIPYFGRGRHWLLEKNVVSANAIIHQVAQKSGLRVAPLYEATKQDKNPFVYAADYFHPNDRGYRNWFAAFWQILVN